MEALRYSEDHLWVRVEGRHARIGLSERGQEELGEVKAIELPEIGEPLEKGEPFAEVESRRTVSELVAPVSGAVTAVNIDLEDTPSLVNDDPHHNGWLVEVDLSDVKELGDLMDPDQYEALASD